MDIAHKDTDALIDKAEKKVKKEYAQAQKEMERKAKAYFSSFADKDAKKLELVAQGKMSQDAYNAWRAQQLLVGEKWNSLSSSLAKDLSNARNISASIVKGYMPEVYALNHNYATYEIEAGLSVDTSYTLYDRQTVERLLRDNPQMLPDPSEAIKDQIKQKKIERWSKQKMTSALTQAILQGESLDKLARRLRSVTSMDAASSIRNARTMMTNAQSAGRYDGYRRAKKMGVKFKVMWIATLDNRTRHEHRLLDGQMQEVDEPFHVGGIEIMYPADYGGKKYKVPPDMIYNCRCSIGAAVKGTRLYDEGIGAANREVGTGQTYEEWKNSKSIYEKKSNAKDNNAPNTLGLTCPKRPRLKDYEGREAEWESAREKYKVQREEYNKKIDKIKEYELSKQRRYDTWDKIDEWAKSNDVIITDRVRTNVDIRVMGDAIEAQERLLKEFPEVRSYYSKYNNKYTFDAPGDDGSYLFEASGGLNFGRTSKNLEYLLDSCIDQQTTGFNTPGDGTMRTFYIHEFGHNVDDEIKFGRMSTFDLSPDSFMKSDGSVTRSEAFKMYQEESKRRTSARDSYRSELIALTKEHCKTEYAFTNENEAFAEGFAEWQTNPNGEYGKAFGKFFEKWRGWK